MRPRGRVRARRGGRDGRRIRGRRTAHNAAARQRGSAGEREQHEAQQSEGTARHPISIGDAAASDVNDLSVAAGRRPRVREPGR